MTARGPHIEDFIPYIEEADERRTTIATRAGGLLRIARYVAPDLESAGQYDLVRHHLRLGAATARFPTGWSVWWDQWRLPAPGYLPESDFGGCRAARRVDDAQRRRFTDGGREVFTNETFVAVHYTPPKVDVRRFLWEGNRRAANAILHQFDTDSSTFFEEVRGAMRGIEILAGEQALSYLFAGVNYEFQPLQWPEDAFLCQALACKVWWNSPTVRIGDKHIATVEIWSPGSPNPLTCDELYSLPYPCRWTATMHCTSAVDQPREIEKVRKAHSMGALRLGTLLERMMTRNKYAGRENPESVEAMEELDQLRKRIRKNPFAHASFNVHLWADDREEADRRASYVTAKLRAQGLSCEPATLNSFRALTGDMPGAVTREVANARRSRVPILAATRVAPVTGVSEGVRWDWRFEGPALLQAATPRGVPFHFSFHAPGSGVGHAAIVGRTDAGKSTLLSFVSLQSLRYPGMRVFFFDRKRSFMVACLCAGGSWHELGPGGTGVQPLRHIDRPDDLGWAHGWVMAALEARGLPRRPHTAEAVTRALRLLATEGDPNERTLSGLYTYLEGDAEARDTLRHYLAGSGGPYGGLFDGVVEGYGAANILAFETDDLSGLGKEVSELALMAVFRAIERDHLRGDAPKLVIFDEAWAWLEPGSLLERRMITAAREYRKFKTCLVLATQEVSDVAEGSARAVFHQCEHKIFLPDAGAEDPNVKIDYLKAGLTEAQVETLASGRTKGDYVFRGNDGVTRLANLQLEGDALRVCGSSSQRDIMRAQALLAEGVRPGEEFLGRWLGDGPVSRPAPELLAAE